MEETHKTRSSLIILGSVLLLLGLSAMIPAKWIGGGKTVVHNQKIDLSLMTSPNQIAKDINGDGGISWKEIVVSTLNASSSVAQGEPVDRKAIEELNDPNNLTASFSKNLYLLSAYFDKNGITDEVTKQKAVNELIENERKKITHTSYGYKDIVVAKTESKESLRAYGNVVAQLLQKTLSKEIGRKDLYSITTYSETKDPSALQDLITNKKNLDSILQKMLTLSVPPSLVSYHLLAINRIASYRDLVKNLSVADTDPMRASFVLNDYTNTTILVFRLYEQFATYFTSHGVVFNEKEPGYVFTVGYTIE